MKKKFTILITAAVMLLTMITPPLEVMGQSDKSETYTSNVTLPTSGTNVSSCVIVIGGNNYSGTKLGKSNTGASASITAPAGTKYIHLHVAAWKDKTTGFTYKVGTGSAVSISDITSNSGISNNSPFTWSTTSGNQDPNSTYHYKVITLASALENATNITFASTDERVVFWGVNCEKTHTITYSATNGSISGVLYNTSTVVASGDPIVEGGKVTLTATPTEGYSFSGWSVEGTGATLSSTSTNPTTFTMGTVNATVTATFEIASVCATPTFTVAEGTYNAAQSVELNCTTDGATIYYTTDGSNPTTSSSVYSSAIDVNVSKTIKAFAVKAGLENSSIASATYTLKCATPTITVPEGAFLNTKTVTMATTTDGASIYYTTDGSTTPTSSSTAYDPSNKPTISATTTIKAIAIKDGWTDSDVATETFTKITPLTVTAALTAIDALADNGTIANQYVAGTISQIDDYSSNSITYWISDDGTTTSQLEVYKGKGLNGANFSAVSDLTVGEIVVVFGTLKKYVYNSTTTPEFTSGSQQVSITHKVKAPTFSPAAGAVAEGTDVTISTTTEGATIYYTTDGSTPTTSSSVYSAPITVSADMTIKALAVKDGYLDSSVAEAAYTIASPCATPTFSVPAGEVEKGTTVTLSTKTDGATIYYTTNGSTPTTSSTAYSSAITINSAMTIKAIAAKDGMANSEVASVSYTVRDYAILPFVWAGGVKSDLGNMTGVTTYGLGSDYAAGNAPYRVKMDGEGDFIQIKTNSKPGKVTIGVKMIGGGTTSKIKVQESNDGSSFTDLEELTISGSQDDILTLTTSNSFAATTRYVKIIKSVHASGGNIGVGPITIDITGSQTITNLTITDNNTLTIPNGGVLTVTGTLTNNGTAANLIIEDGGQVITTSSGVQATFKKSVSHGTAKTAENWYTISSPVNNVATASVTNLIQATPANYDLYYYDEATQYWFNHKADGHTVTNMTNGKGYLYWNNGGDELSFPGELNSGDIEIAVTKNGTTDLAGFNLIGNPYSHNIYKGDGTAIPNSKTSDYFLSTGFYTLSNDGEWQAGTDNTTAITPGQGILVKATSAGTITMTNTTASSSAKRGDEFVKFTVANSKYEDVAYVLFSDEVGLNKINHLNEEVPMLSITKDNDDFAIATITEAQGEMPVNFKAATDGTYTINVSTKGIETDYLHLIDNRTGMDIDLLQTPSYTFEASKSDYASRFRLVFSASNNNESHNENENFGFISNGNLMILGIEGEATLQMIDVTGRVLSNETFYGNYNKAINAKAGLYMLRLIQGENVRTQKIVVR